jgi:hypothetical protein
MHFKAKDGRNYHAPDTDPQVPNTVASRVSAVVGLETASRWHSNARSLALSVASASTVVR